MTKLCVKIRFAWWLDYYVATLIFMCRLFGTVPDDEKLERMIRLAMKKPKLVIVND